MSSTGSAGIRISVLIKSYLGSVSSISQESICEEEELSHDDGDGHLRRFSNRDEGLVYGLKVRVDAGGDQGGHIEGLARIGSANTDEGAAFPSFGLLCDGSQPGQGEHERLLP